ncbi:MAG: Manganese transport system rane protein MntB [Planctomycetota bacterium]
MNDIHCWTWEYDGWLVLAAVLCAVAATIPGNFLVLRRMSLLGDAISHAVLPGLAAAFWFTQTRDSLPVFLGAVITGLLTAILTQWIQNLGKVDEGASIGVVFTTLFAVGLVMMSYAAPRVDLDPNCVLYGQLEASPLESLTIGSFTLPRIVLTLGIVMFVNIAVVAFFFKELLISSFDPGLATTEGCNAQLMHHLLMVIVAVTAVASFEAAGNILFVAMLIVPPATALLLTQRLGSMIIVSACLAAVAAVSGHVAATTIPRWFGFRSTSTAGMITVCSGLLFLITAAFSPSNGFIAIWLRRQRLALRILSEDVLALLYRLEERGSDRAESLAYMSKTLLSSTAQTWLALQRQRIRGWISTERPGFRLTAAGRQAAAAIVRSHRLWESYLVQEGIDAGVIHRQAEKLEHFTGRSLRDRLQVEGAASDRDPHGSVIPEENSHSA